MSLGKGFFALFPEFRTWAHPRRRLMARTLWLMTAFLAMVSTRMMLSMCGAWSFVMAKSSGGTLTLSIPNGGHRGNAEVAGVRDPCRLRGMLKIPELWRRGSLCGAQCCPSQGHCGVHCFQTVQLVLTSSGVRVERFSPSRVARCPLARMAWLVWWLD